MAPHADDHCSPSPQEIPLGDRPRLYGWPTENDRGYKINEAPSGTLRPMRIIVIGAGASGISFAKFAEHDLQNVTVQIYEKNRDVGGTWLENRYPGCACDVPSVTYQFTWEPTVWSKYYSESPEIHAYFKGVVDKYKLWKYIKLNHRVDHAEWDEDAGKWRFKIYDSVNDKVIQDECDIFVNAGGPLNYWEWPKIPGLSSFKGILAHTAAYPEGLDLKGKRVAVCGIGSSGIQVIAKIQPEVSHLYTWIRTPTWVLGSFGSKYIEGEGPNPEYTEEQKHRMIEDPDTYLKYRKNVEGNISQGFDVFYKGTPASVAAQKYATNEMMTRLKGNKEIADALIPKSFPVGCKRPTPGSGFLEALISDNVTTYPGGDLRQITPNGFIDPSGQEQEVDVIILATGFNTTWVPRFPIIANGRNLQDMYAENPLSYLGLAAPCMPSYFTYYGPYGPLGQASAVVMIEFFTRYIISVTRKMQIEDIKSVTPKMDVALKFQEHADLYLKRTVWDANCRSWWKGGKVDGRIMLYPGSRTQYMELIDQPRYEDYEVKYRNDNPWYFLGNGFSTRDYDGRDITWFWGLVDGVDKQMEYDLDWKVSEGGAIGSNHVNGEDKKKDKEDNVFEAAKSVATF